MSTIDLPIVSIPMTLAEKIKAHGNLSFKSLEIKQIVDAAFNCFLDEIANKNNSITIPKFCKMSRKLLNAREFRIPGSSDPDATTRKPKRYNLVLAVSAATKSAFETIVVLDNESVNNDEEEEIEEPVAKPVKAPKADKPVKAPKADKAIKAPKADKAIKNEIEPAELSEPSKPASYKATKSAKADKSAKSAKSKKGGNNSDTMQLEPEEYNNVDDGEFSDGM